MSDVAIFESNVTQKMVDLGDGAYGRLFVAILPALGYTATNIALTANQIAGTDPIIAANANRRGLMFSASGDFRLALASGQAAGMPIYSSARDSLIGSECPLGALYMVSGSGFAVGAVLTVWEA